MRCSPSGIWNVQIKVVTWLGIPDKSAYRDTFYTDAESCKIAFQI